MMEQLKKGTLEKDVDDTMRMTGFGVEVDENDHKEYFEVMKIFEGRDFKQERRKIINQAESLTNKNQVSSFAKKGYYVLEQVRG